MRRLRKIAYGLDYHCFSGDLVQLGILTTQSCAGKRAWIPGYSMVSEESALIYATTDERFAKNLRFRNPRLMGAMTFDLSHATSQISGATAGASLYTREAIAEMGCLATTEASSTRRNNTSSSYRKCAGMVLQIGSKRHRLHVIISFGLMIDADVVKCGLDEEV